MGAGVVSTAFLNDAVLESRTVQRLNLPGLGNRFGDAVYRLVIPMGAASLINKFGPRSFRAFARGLMLGGFVNSLSAMIGFVSTKMNPTGMYFADLYANNGGRTSAVGLTPGYSGLNASLSRQNSMSGIFDSESAFPSDGWSKAM